MNKGKSKLVPIMLYPAEEEMLAEIMAMDQKKMIPPQKATKASVVRRLIREEKVRRLDEK